MLLLRKVKSLNLRSSLHLLPLYPLSASVASNNLRIVHTVVHICGKKSMYKWTKQSKPLFFKCQLYFNQGPICVGEATSLHWEVDITEQGRLRQVCLVRCSAWTSPFPKSFPTSPSPFSQSPIFLVSSCIEQKLINL